MRITETTKWQYLFDLQEAKKTNMLISGANHSGKTRLSCAIANILHNLGYTVIAIDVSGVWKKEKRFAYFMFAFVRSSFRGSSCTEALVSSASR